ncbi:MAG TPA: lytic transglycosylase domain-containing protein [Nocardioides sp.]|nr:lytic transglycosylase domain-containing protein [Nocardioides sp.]
MALVPLALLSAAWTASIAGVGVSSASADESPNATLPDGTSVPTEAIKAPASVSVAGDVAPGITDPGNAVATASTSGIPSAALAAYQRAETVINAADKSCQLPWQLVAAIGRVESDHGRTNGNTLDSEGVARPGIYGIALDGTHKTSLIRDTDAGSYDSDAKFDRAVGPMQFIPSTWSVVGVDADGDAQRNPQDIDDAALASAVYLCAGDDDLSTTPGQRASVYRYNHSQSYVDLVLSIMNAYMDGDFTAVPNETTSAGYFVPDTSAPVGPGRNQHQGGHHNGGGTGGGGGGGTSGGTTSGGTTAETPTETPTTPPSTGGGGTPTVPTPTVSPLPSPTLPPVDEVLTEAEAIIQCTKEGYNALTNKAAFDKCVYDYTH